MTWGEEWTPEKVKLRLVQVFRDLPGAPVYSPRKNEFTPVHGEPIDNLHLLACTADALGRDSPERIILLVWARLLATENSVRSYCHDKHVSRSTVYEQVNRAARTVAEHINRIGQHRVAA